MESNLDFVIYYSLLFFDASHDYLKDDTIITKEKASLG